LSLVELKLVCYHSWVKTVVGELEGFATMQEGEWTGKTTSVVTHLNVS